MGFTNADLAATIDKGFEERDTRSDAGLASRDTDLCRRVFSIDLLREHIISYVIYKNDGGISKQDAISCRLVQKSWAESVFKCFVKSGTSLIDLDISEGWACSVTPFLTVYQPSTRLPIRLHVLFQPGTIDSHRNLFYNCIDSCGNELVELRLTFLVSNILLQRNEICLPVLQKLRYSFPLSEVSHMGEDNDEINVSAFLQAVLASCLSVKHFNLDVCGVLNDSLHMSLGNFLLPVSITHLVLDCKMVSKYLEQLIRNNMFLKVTDLTVVLSVINNGDKPWFKELLLRVSNTLKSLKIIHLNLNSMDKAFISELDPPVMTKLQKIFIRGTKFQWADNITNLQKRLPKLKEISIRNVTTTSLRKWTANSEFNLVTDLSLHFYNYGSPNATDFFSLESATLVSEAFSKVTHLDIQTPCMGSVNQAMQCVFKNMTQLQVLTLILYEVQEHRVHPRYLDAQLLGISCELIDTLKAVCGPGELYEAVKRRIDMQYSVFNLSQLQKLTLLMGNFLYNDPTYVSEKVRQFVISSMPNLQEIELPAPTLTTYLGINTQEARQTGRVFNWE